MNGFFVDACLKDYEKVRWVGRKVNMTAPSVVKPGEKFSVRVSAVGHDQMPLGEAVRLESVNRGDWEGIPEKIEVVPGGICIDDVSIGEPGLYYLHVKTMGADGAVDIFSNPVFVKENPECRLFWGDLHIHSIDGWCSPHSAKTPGFAFSYARNVSFLDFLCVTDHNDQLNSEKWEKQKYLVTKYGKSGEFVPFLGFESSHGSSYGGDNNVYFRYAKGDFLPRENNKTDIALEELWQFLDDRKNDYMTIPHHTGRKTKYRSWDEGRYSPGRETLFEIYSMWGSSECRHSRYPLMAFNTDKPAYFTDAIRKGCRFGVIASGDDHTTMPGSESVLCMSGRPQMSNYAHHGLAGIFSPALDSESLWAAMKNRRTLAVTYGRPIFLFKAEGQPSGSELILGRYDGCDKKRRLSVSFAPAFPERQEVHLTLMRNGFPIDEKKVAYNLNTGLCSIEFVDEASFKDIAIYDAPFCDKPFIVYYVRMEAAQGDTAWSSPIWFLAD